MRVTPALLAATTLLTAHLPPPTTIRCVADDPVTEPAGDDRTERLIRNLLLQRSVQTQLHYFRELKNGFSTTWLADFSDAQGTARLAAKSTAGRLLHCHTGMRNVEWDEYMMSMFNAPDVTQVVSVMGRSRPNGLSPNNPYLKAAPSRPARTYTETVRPAAVARQVLQIREEIAEEWVSDLALIEKDNVELLRHHAEEVKHLVDDELRFQYLIQPCEAGDGESSPLRLASYDLLKNAVTAEALRLLVERLGKTAETQHSSGWLRGFSAEHARPLLGVAEHEKTQRSVDWHGGRDALLTMMSEPVSMGLSPSGEARFLDPLSLAEAMMRLRATIANEWIAACKQVPDEHLVLARKQLTARNLFGDVSLGEESPAEERVDVDIDR